MTKPLTASPSQQARFSANSKDDDDLRSLINALNQSLHRQE